VRYNSFSRSTALLRRRIPAKNLQITKKNQKIHFESQAGILKKIFSPVLCHIYTTVFVQLYNINLLFFKNMAY
jgi:hypothetical protein